MVIDSHCHILPPDFPQRRADLLNRDATFASLFSNPQAPMATAERLIASMDRDGVERAVVMGMGWTDPSLAREVNDYIIASVARSPARLTGFCSASPGWGDAGAEEIERCVAAGLRGVGELHPDSQGFDITDKAVLAPLMETASRLGLPVLVHASEPVGHDYPGKGSTTPERLYRFIQNFPANLIILAHWGGGLPFYALMPEVPDVIRNVYFDTAASPFLYGFRVFPVVAGLVGPDKVLFGTDYPLVSAPRLLAQLNEAGLEAGDRQAILSGNAARLFGL